MGKRGRISRCCDWNQGAGLQEIESWARQQATDKQIAEDLIGVSERTFSRWKHDFPEIREALHRGRIMSNISAEEALLRAALGYTETIQETTRRSVTDKGSHVIDEEIEVKEKTRYIKPSVLAQIRWLSTRDPEHWKRTFKSPKHQKNPALNLPITLADLFAWPALNNSLEGARDQVPLLVDASGDRPCERKGKLE